MTIATETVMKPELAAERFVFWDVGLRAGRWHTLGSIVSRVCSGEIIAAIAGLE